MFANSLSAQQKKKQKKPWTIFLAVGFSKKLESESEIVYVRDKPPPPRPLLFQPIPLLLIIVLMSNPPIIIIPPMTRDSRVKSFLIIRFLVCLVFVLPHKQFVKAL